jgi:RNA polymerase sigma-70 factor (ECF subfamily)
MPAPIRRERRASLSAAVATVAAAQLDVSGGWQPTDTRVRPSTGIRCDAARLEFAIGSRASAATQRCQSIEASRLAPTDIRIVAQLPNPNTRVTLLGRLRDQPDDQSTWSEFVDWYGRMIYAWCRTWGLQESDTQEVTQEVFLKLAVRMREFRYDPNGSFRAWLKTITHHAWQDYLGKQRRPGAGSGSDTVADRLADLPAQDDLAHRLELACDEELLREAAVRVRLRVEPRTWDAFELTAKEGRSGADAAAQLNMKVATVFVARSKVQRMLREEVARLERV